MGWDERTAVVATTLGDEKLLLYSMTARETLGRPFLYEIDLLSTDEKIDLSSLLGEPIQVALQLPDYSYREFNGVITHFSLTGELGHYARYQVVAAAVVVASEAGPQLARLQEQDRADDCERDVSRARVQRLFRVTDAPTSTAPGNT
ncbi:MAG: contractile injection system protein, VgrG/Pvc8 family [Polyangiaceae bacterium]